MKRMRLQLAALDISPLPKITKKELEKCQNEGLIQAVFDCEKVVISLRSTVLSKLDSLISALHDEQIQEDIDNE